MHPELISFYCRDERASTTKDPFPEDARRSDEDSEERLWITSRCTNARN
jgi:hypothetical protein